MEVANVCMHVMSVYKMESTVRRGRSVERRTGSRWTGLMGGRLGESRSRLCLALGRILANEFRFLERCLTYR